MDTTQFFEKVINSLFEEEKVKDFEDKLEANNSRFRNLNGFIEYSTAEGIGLAIIWLALVVALKQPLTYFAFGIIFLIAPLFLNYLWQDVSFENRKRKKEGMLAELLLEASVFCDESSFLNTIKRLGESDFELIANDFSRVYREIKAGASASDAIERLKRLNKSQAYSRVANLLLQGYNSGAKMSEVFKDTAEDLMEMQAIMRERQAVMLINKYTLMLASALIVPAILGLIVGLVQGLSFDSVGELSFGLSIEARKAIFASAMLGAWIYIVEYAIISSFFLAIQEGNKKNFWINALLIVPIALIVFASAQAL